MRITIWTGTMLAITLLAALSSAGVTGDISGRVVDAQTGHPIVGAVVTVEGTSLATRTRLDGTYTIPDVPAGIHTVSLASSGTAPAGCARSRSPRWARAARCSSSPRPRE